MYWSEATKMKMYRSEDDDRIAVRDAVAPRGHLTHDLALY